METSLYSWQYDDTKNRWKVWYILAISIIIWLIIWWIFTRQYGFSVIIFLVSGIYLFVENNSSDTVKVLIHENGVKVSESFYEYEKIENYSYVFSKENPVFLLLNLQKKWLRQLHLQINQDIYETLEKILPNYIEKTENKPLSKIETLLQILKL